jgi:ATP-dependent DNA ligase
VACEATIRHHRRRDRRAVRRRNNRFFSAAERTEGKIGKIVFVAFRSPLPERQRPSQAVPVLERKAELKKVVAKSSLQFSETFEIDGGEMLAHACKIGLEGVASKVRDSRYVSGRGNDWAKKAACSAKLVHRRVCA